MRNAMSNIAESTFVEYRPIKPALFQVNLYVFAITCGSAPASNFVLKSAANFAVRDSASCAFNLVFNLT